MNPNLLPDKPWRKPSIPTLGGTCRHFREYQRLGRGAVQKRLRLSTSYLFRIEAQGHIPRMQIVDQLIEGYRLDNAQGRHLRGLVVPAQHLEPAHELRDRVTNSAGQMAHLRDLESRGVLGAYVDPFATILACNHLFRSALPGIEEMGSYPVWLFSPMAKNVVIDWEHEADHCVASAKGALGLYRDSHQALDLLRHLRNIKEFQNRWAASIHISYGRDTNDPLHLRDPSSEAVTAYNFSQFPESHGILLCVGFPKDDTRPRRLT
ncbi:helix-turn-helix domain-containing protein [Nocardia vulneris]|uniref:MmyB family transcriptional regulator n=1 Tax=Nocardia vulneris TaxID=1141657 RepID=UPI0030CF997F